MTGAQRAEARPRQDRSAERVALLSVATSAILAVAKIAIGLSAQSVATVSDGIESAGDVLTSGLVFIALRVSARPADADHPYGHGRVDILAGLAVGVLLVLAGAGICWRSLTVEDRTPQLYAAWPIAASIITKGLLATAKMRAGRRSRSAALIADAWNDSVDVLSGLTALAAVLIAVYTPGGMPRADQYGGFAIGLIVLFLALRTIQDTALQLMDTMPAPEQMEQIRAVALEVPGALGIDKCFARKTGMRYHVDLHLEVDPNLTVRESHKIAHDVQHHLRNRVDWIEDVLVHVEPYGKS
jgi:cation diffusion facilitator family transporter